MVGSKTANVRWIQRANLCFGKAPETSSHAVLAIRGLSRVEGRYYGPGKQKAELEMSEDWAPCSGAAWKEQCGKHWRKNW